MPSHRSIIWTYRLGQRTRKNQMNFWVEWWPKKTKVNGSHAQMREQLQWEEPEPEVISRRWFSTQQEASNYANAMKNKEEYFYRLKHDGQLK